MGMLIVFEIAPLMNGWAAAIMRMCASTAMYRCPIRPHRFAQSKIGATTRELLEERAEVSELLGS